MLAGTYAQFSSCATQYRQYRFVPHSQVTSTLFDGLSASPTTSDEGAVFAENRDQLALLADVGNALAFGSEAEEELGETSAGSLVLQVRLSRS